MRRLSHLSMVFALGAICSTVVLAGYAVYAWTGPTGTAPNNNVAAPINTSATAQTKSGVLSLTNGLIVGGTTLWAGASGGNVGVGMTNPSNKFHVTGNIGATGWIGAGCETACETGGGYSLMYANGEIISTSNMRSPIFYDNDNTGFYVDPASVSVMNDIRPSIIYDRDNTGYYVNPNSNSRMYYGGFDLLYSYGYSYADIFYDTGNANYYMRPRGTSNMNQVYVASLCLGGTCRTSWPGLGATYGLQQWGTGHTCVSGSYMYGFTLWDTDTDGNFSTNVLTTIYCRYI